MNICFFPGMKSSKTRCWCTQCYILVRIESKIIWWVWDILHRPMAQGWNSFYTQQYLRICDFTRNVMTVRLVNGRECWDLGGGGDSLAANPRSWAKNFLLRKNSGWNSASAGVVYWDHGRYFGVEERRPWKLLNGWTLKFPRLWGRI